MGGNQYSNILIFWCSIEVGIYLELWRNQMASEFRTTMDHGTYVLSALVKSDSDKVELFLIGEREGVETRILESGDKPFHSCKLSKATDRVDVFRSEYVKYLETGGKEELEGVLNPISVFNVVAVEPDELVMPEPIVEEKTAVAKPRAKAKPKPKN